MPVEPIDLRQFDEVASNIYEGIIIAAKRARQINDENKIEFNALVSTIPTTTNDDESEDIENPAQLKIALEFEKRDKPYLVALDELLSKNIEYDYKQVDI